jgi:acyl dehydratase
VNLEALRDHRFPVTRVAYTDKETILYALSVGAGADPRDPRELRLVFERDLHALPTMAAVLAHPGAWIADPRFGVNYPKLLHGEQQLIVHHPIAPAGEIDASYRIAAIVDKGEGKGALVYFEKRLHDAASSALLCTVRSALFLRGDGGAGSFGTPPEPLPGPPDVKLERLDELKTSIDAALLYRLNGDRNPIHADPTAAAKAGFDRPILHGLCTFGVVGYLLTRTVCNHDPTRLLSLGARFSSPVFPGETIRLEAARRSDEVFFRATVPERDEVVLSQGFARVS